jgi:hypothetical protein
MNGSFDECINSGKVRTATIRIKLWYRVATAILTSLM